MLPISSLPIRDRLLLNVHVDPTGCWLWQGTKFTKTGYGQVTHNKKIPNSISFATT